MLRGARQPARFTEETMTGRQKVLHLKQPLGTFVQAVDEVTQKHFGYMEMPQRVLVGANTPGTCDKDRVLTTMIHCSDRLISVH